MTNAGDVCQVCVDAGGTSAWEGWLKGMLQTGLAGAPLDMAEAWAAAVRFVVHSLARTYPAGLTLVLDVIMQAPPQGMQELALPLDTTGNNYYSCS